VKSPTSFEKFGENIRREQSRKSWKEEPPEWAIALGA